MLSDAVKLICFLLDPRRLECLCLDLYALEHLKQLLESGEDERMGGAQ